jgi:hypothetical protein
MNSSAFSSKYDVALSFAGEDREYVEAVAVALRKKGLRVFYDGFEEADLIGRNLVDHLSEIYQNTARLCVVFVSQAYARKPFPRMERQAAQARAMQSGEPYIIPVRLDDAEIPGLLPTIAYVSGKTPEALSQLIASKLLLAEPPGHRLPETVSKGDAVLVRFTSILEPDMNCFHESIVRFTHWAEDKLFRIPVELRIPEVLRKHIEDANLFRHGESFGSSAIGAETRQQFVQLLDERIPEFLNETIKGVQTVVHRYWFAREERLEPIVRRFLITRMTILCRLLLDFQLIGMQTPDWEPMFAHFTRVWSEWVMYGLSYACFLDGDERFLWIDVDGRDETPTIKWPQGRFRLYMPSELAMSKDYYDPLTTDQFDRFFATQFLYYELEKSPGLPLDYFARHPERLRITIRGESAVETEHFGQIPTSGHGSDRLFESIRKLRDQVIVDAQRSGLENHQRFLIIHRIRRLIPNGDLLNKILFPETVDPSSE